MKTKAKLTIPPPGLRLLDTRNEALWGLMILLKQNCPEALYVHIYLKTEGWEPDGLKTWSSTAVVTMVWSGATWRTNWYAGISQCCSISGAASSSSWSAWGSISPSSRWSSHMFSCNEVFTAKRRQRSPSDGFTTKNEKQWCDSWKLNPWTLLWFYFVYFFWKCLYLILPIKRPRLCTQTHLEGKKKKALHHQLATGRQPVLQQSHKWLHSLGNQFLCRHPDRREITQLSFRHQIDWLSFFKNKENKRLHTSCGCCLCITEAFGLKLL